MPIDKSTMGRRELSSSQKLTGADEIGKLIKEDPSISNDLETIFRRRGIDVPQILKPDRIFVPPSDFPSVSFDPAVPLPLPTPTPAAPQPAPTMPEIDTKLQLLINAIPIANPGNIITSEYHNALRDAVRALASRIGLDVNPAAEFKILTFAPAFLPLFPQTLTGTTATPTGNNNRWDVTLSRAAITIVSNPAQPVSGGICVQLPDGATVFQMIVRGSRLGKDQPAPKDFTVALKRGKFGKDQPLENLISVDLKGVKDGPFEVDETVKLSEAEASTTTNALIAGLTVADRKVVDNEKWIYYVTAEWLNGDPNANSAKFEIYSIQIICNVSI
jgi:hypothetical protein